MKRKEEKWKHRGDLGHSTVLVEHRGDHVDITVMIDTGVPRKHWKSAVHGLLLDICGPEEEDGAPLPGAE